jgi:iron complex outermembrane receptor protein
LGLLDTEFTDFQVLNDGPDYSGNVFVRSPHVTGLLRGNYRIELPGDSGPSLLLGADYRWMSSQVHFTTNQDNPLLGTSPFSVLNARVSLESNDQKLLLTAYVNNALNVKYRAHTLPAARDASGAAVTWSDPWTAGVSLTARWY